MKRFEVPGGLRFMTFSCQRRLPLLLDPAVAQHFVDAMVRVRRTHAILLYAWVIMPEHIHMRCTPAPATTLESSLRSIKMSVAKRMLGFWKESGDPILATLHDETGRPRFWQKGGGFDRNVRDNAEFRREVIYIHRSPVERGLVSNPQDWRWSSVRWWMGQRDNEVECDPVPSKSGSGDFDGL